MPEGERESFVAVFLHILEDIIFVLYLAPNGILCKTLISEQNKKTSSEPSSPGLCLGHTPEPSSPAECSLKTTAFKVPKIFSKEGPRERLAVLALRAGERTFVVTVSERLLGSGLSQAFRFRAADPGDC